MGYRIDRLTAAHHVRVAEISTFGAGPGGRRSVVLPSRLGRLRDFLAGRGYPFDLTYGAVVADEAAPGLALGYALVGVLEPLPSGLRAGHAFLCDVCVAPECRRRGAGAALVGGLLDHATLAEGVDVWAAVPEPLFDVMGLLGAAGRGRGLVVIPGSRLDEAALSPLAYAVLSRGAAPDRHVFRFPAPARGALAVPTARRRPAARARWTYSDKDRRAS